MVDMVGDDGGWLSMAPNRIWPSPALGWPSPRNGSLCPLSPSLSGRVYLRSPILSNVIHAIPAPARPTVLPHRVSRCSGCTWPDAVANWRVSSLLPVLSGSALCCARQSRASEQKIGGESSSFNAMQRCCKRAHSKSENARRPYREVHPNVHEWCAW